MEMPTSDLHSLLIQSLNAGEFAAKCIGFCKQGVLDNLVGLPLATAKRSTMVFIFFRPTPYGFRQVVQHVSKHVAYEIN